MNTCSAPASFAVESLSVVTYQQQPVVTTELLAQLYGTDAHNILKNFNSNSDRFVSGKHFIKLEGEALREFKRCITESDSVKIPVQTRNLLLWTERGAARHAKMLDTDQAWEVFEKLEDCYFKPQATPALPHFVDFDQQMLLTRIMDSRGFSREWEQRAWDELHRFFQVRELERLPYNSFFDACYLILNYPKPKPSVPRTRRIAPPPAPRNALVNLFSAPDGEETRWLVVKDVHGDLYGKLLPKNSFEFDPERLAEIISDPGGLVRKALLPGILAAVAKRM